MNAAEKFLLTKTEPQYDKERKISSCRCWYEASRDLYRAAFEYVTVISPSSQRSAILTRKRARIINEMATAQLRIYTDFDEMLDREKPDSVIVCSTDCFHSLFITKSLMAGCDVITEKPMTINQAFMPQEVTWGIRFGDCIYDEDMSDNWHFSLNWRYIIPPTKENVEKHPEWFAREEGKLPEYHPRHNFCITNPEVFKIVMQKVREAFDSNPKRKMFSLEPNDHQDYCNCKTCKALEKRLGPRATGKRHLCLFLQPGDCETEKDPS